jgi:hypothetical protein
MWVVESKNEAGVWFICCVCETLAEANEAVRLIRADGFEARRFKRQ